MSAEWFLRNLAIYSVQLTAVVACAAFCVALLRLRSPRPRLAVWHIALLCCLAMPWVMPHQSPDPDRDEGTVSAASTITGMPDGESGSGFRWPFSLSETALAILFGGAGLRLLWIGTGLLKLRGMARRAELMRPAPAPVERARWLAGAEARFCWSEEVAGPVTFGFRTPVVLLPVDFGQLSDAEQTSVALHEALHVARRDWLFTMFEELVRAALWFHPAVWFLLNRIQLAREQAVDQAVVEVTKESDEYVGALLKIAAARIEPDLAPAPLFLKRRHLRERVDAIMKGSHMTKSRLVLSMFAVLLVVPVVAGLIAWQLPLRAAAQTAPQDSAGVEVRTGAYKVLHRSAVSYPLEARDKGLAGSVVVSVTVNRDGEVVDARVTGATGPEELKRAALSSVLQWHFMPPGSLPSTFEVTIGFNPANTPSAPDPPVSTGGAAVWTIDRIDLSRVPAELRPKIQEALTVREGQPVRPEEVREQERILRKIDSHLTLGIVRPRGADARSDTVSLSVAVRQPTVVSEASVPPAGDTAQRIRVGGNVAANNLITKVTPLYPQEAKEARIQGVVKFMATIGKDGRIEQLELLSGHPMLVLAALDAVKQWVYKPTLLNGNPVSVVTQIDINFTLAP